jgi:hypothetical protein
MKSKLIINSFYKVVMVKGDEIVFTYKKYSHTRFADFSVENSDVREMTPALKIIAKRERLDLTKFEQFEMCLTALKHSVSWN